MAPKKSGTDFYSHPTRPTLNSGLPRIAFATLATFALVGTSFQAIASDNIPSVQNAQTEWSSHTLHAELHSLVMKRLSSVYPGADITLSVEEPHQQIRRKACSDYQLELNPQLRSQRIPVKVTCAKPHRWSFFATVNAKVMVEALVALQALPRGSTLAPELLALRQFDLSQLRSGWVGDHRDLAGFETKRTLMPDTPIRVSDLVRPKTITRGQEIVIMAIAGAARVSTKGTALESGHFGEQIEVKNRTSGRVIAAWVVGKGTVQTSPPGSSAGR